MWRCFKCLLTSHNWRMTDAIELQTNIWLLTIKCIDCGKDDIVYDELCPEDFLPPSDEVPS